MNFHQRVGKLELRSCDEALMQCGEHDRAEIVQWQKDGSCLTIVFWEPGEDVHQICYVQDRFLEANGRTLSQLQKSGQYRLNKALLIAK